MRKNYFAYGSNMLSKRLRHRIPSAKAIGTYTLPAHDLRFHKRSDRDNSGKCDVYQTDDQNDAVIGILFTIESADECKLDKAEGLGNGYEKKEVEVGDENGTTETAFTYYANRDCINDAIRPFTWYKQHVVTGAKEGGLPAEYIAKIEAVEADEDPDQDREQREMALHD